MSAKITDHRARAQAVPQSYFKQEGLSAAFQALIGLIADNIQELEDLYDLVLINTLLDNATGVELDRYGLILGEFRGALGDTDYRSVLRVVVAIAQSDGTAQETEDIFSDLVNSAAKYLQTGRAAYCLLYSIGVPIGADFAERVARLSRGLRPVGVEHCIVEHESGVSFQFDSGPGFDVGTLARRIDVLE